MIQIASYSAADVFAAMNTRGKATLPDGRTFRKNSARLVLFKTKGTVCVRCGIKGTQFILETHDLTVTPHLNLYGMNVKGELVLMTKDHIVPKSKGGLNALENYDPMCSPCNAKKGSKPNLD